MARKARRRTTARATRPNRLPLLLALSIGTLLLVAVGATMWDAWRPGPPTSPAEPTAWANLGTRDVHSLSFVTSEEHLLFGHHDGILESVDGGRTWRPLPVRADAMSLAVEGPSIVIAGHYVFQESTDGGRSWADIPADLPNLDIHAFTRGIADPARMWAYLAEGGVYESLDGGRRWEKVFDDHIPYLAATLVDGRDVLLGLHPIGGLVRSDDAGRSWTAVGDPPTAPVTALAATPSGEVVLLGAPRGLFRSDDAGRSWRHVLDAGTVLAIAVSAAGRTLAAVTADTSFYRSDDGGDSWPPP